MNSSPLCVDANLVIRLVADPDDDRVRSAWERWDAEHRRIAAPPFLFYDVSNALYRYQRAGMMSSTAVRLALRAALALPLRVYGERELHTRALDLAGRRVLDRRPPPGPRGAGRAAVGVHSRRRSLTERKIACI